MIHAHEMRRLIRLLEDVPLQSTPPQQGAAPQQQGAPQQGAAPQQKGAPQQGNLPPEAISYMTRNPTTVADDPATLLAHLTKHAETGARFRWAIAKLPDGRYLEAPSERVAKLWGLPIAQQGDDDDLAPHY